MSGSRVLDELPHGGALVERVTVADRRRIGVGAGGRSAQMMGSSAAIVRRGIGLFLALVMTA